MDCCRSFRSTLCGLSLVETIITLAIVALLSVAAVPGFIDLVRANRLSTQTGSFVVAANLARSEAVKRNQRVVICARAGLQCSGINRWEAGWIVFVDPDGDTLADEDDIIRLFEPLTKGYTLRSNARANALAYFGDGRARRSTGGLPLMTFKLCAPGAKVGNLRQRTREMVISASGRMRLQVGREGVTVCP